MHFFSLILFLLVAILFVAAIFWFVISILSAGAGVPPPIPVRDAILKRVLDELQLNAQSVFVDAGCGNGKMLLAVARKFPNATIIGIERDFIPFAIAKFRTRKFKNISVIRKNIFDYDFSRATHVYAYLLLSMMDDLHPKFERELEPNAMLISCDFPFPYDKKTPERMIHVEKNNFVSVGNKIFVYTF